MSAQVLRPYQSKAIDDIRALIARGVKRILLVLATGGGKTSCFAAMAVTAAARGRRILFVVHRKELIDQCSERLDQHGVDHGVIMSGHPRQLPWLPVQVASVQTLVRRNKPPADLIFVDEAHLARAASYEKILSEYPNAIVIGLTATPWRLDGRGLGEQFQEVVVASTPKQLIAEGFLVPYTGFSYDVPDTSTVKSRAGEYASDGLELVMGGTQIMGSILGKWMEHSQGKRSLGFSPSVAHSKAMAERFREAGVPSEHVDGSMDPRERSAVLERWRRGETLVVWNCSLYTEGLDVPAIETVMLARPTLSLSLYLQMVGRAMRPSPATGKTVARIHDHAGCILEHGLPDAERDYSLTSDQSKRRKAPLPPIRTCKECLAMYDPQAHDECPQCGFAPAVAGGAGAIREIADAEEIPLEKIHDYQSDSIKRKRSYYEAQLRVAAAKGHNLRWALHRYKYKYKVEPPSEWRKAWEAARAAESNLQRTA